MDHQRSPLLMAAAASRKFLIRRASARFIRAPAMDTIIVDVDRTITKEDSPKLALERLVGPKKANEIIDGYIRDAICGRIQLDDIHHSIFRELYGLGFKRSDWAILMMEFDRSGGLRSEFVETLLELARRRSITPIVATRASKESAEWLGNRFGFDAALGSIERPSNGSFGGFETVIGAHDGVSDGVMVMTKMTAASISLGKVGRKLDPARTAVITNDLLDALEMLSSARGVLFVPKEQNKLERITAWFGLYDKRVFESGDLGIQLRASI